jgi:hypothetical protein
MNKESILNQLQEAEYQIRRLKTLIQADDNDILNSEDNLRKGLHCCFKARNELHSIISELRQGLVEIKDNRKEILSEIVKSDQEMGLYDDTSNPMIKEPEYSESAKRRLLGFGISTEKNT